MLLVVAVHAELEEVLVLRPAHEAQVPGLGDGGGARGTCPAQGSVGGEQLSVRRLVVHRHQRPVGVQRLLVVSEKKVDEESVRNYSAHPFIKTQTLTCHTNSLGNYHCKLMSSDNTLSLC